MYATSDDYAADTEKPITVTERMSIMNQHNKAVSTQAGRVWVEGDDIGKTIEITDWSRKQMLEWLGY